MVIYKTDIKFYVLFFIFLFSIIGFLIYITIQYFNFNDTIEDVNKDITTNNINSNQLQVFTESILNSLDNKQIATVKLFSNNINNINTNSNINIKNAELNNIDTINFKSFNTNNINTITTDIYNENKYNMIYGYICVNYYTKNNNTLYNTNGKNFFSVYINENPPASNININNIDLFLQNQNKIVDFEIFNTTNIDNTDKYKRCSSFCNKYSIFGSNNSKSDRLSIPIQNGIFESFDMINTITMDNNIKVGVFPNNGYMNNINRKYDLYLPDLTDLDVNGYIKYGVYNSTLFELNLDKKFEIFQLESKLQYYDIIAPKFLIYNNDYGSLDPTVCVNKSVAKYSYNNADTNFILTNSSKINSIDKKVENKRYINLMTSGYSIMPSFIIQFKLTYFDSNYNKTYDFCI